jgi:hypothetical protein
MTRDVREFSLPCQVKDDINRELFFIEFADPQV